ncbi:ABC transporter substrate-binding protein [Kineococcus sp. SYSU DK004]|uniref:ABC transporter substrate-binding protein n=1 Tax=Kineococcus sp. SYSU DK004 TaxID=3383125 RepID=UPI003D7D8C82
MFFPRRPSIALAAALASALALAACSGGDGGGSDDGGPAEPVSADQFEEAMSTPTELTFWTWVPDIENQVAMFEEAYPEIDVNVVNAGQGLDQYTALRTALRAGQGAPDVVQIEYQYLSSFLVGGDLLDLSPYQGISDLESEYPDWVWEQVTRDGAVYGIPQDTGPMGLLYRDDLFAEAGIAPPTTWDEFAQAARTYREAKPDSYITDFPPNQAGQMIGLMWANGAQPFSYDGEETVSIDLDTPEVTEVVEYWQGLVQDELVAVDPDFTDQWYQGLSNGTYATWVAAAWGPVFLQGSAENTSGLWRAAQLPQWEAGGQSTGNWGGSTDAVVASSANPIAAAELARWINVEQEPALALATEQFLFPPSQSVLEDPAFIDAAPEFYGGQQVNQLFAEASEQVNTDFGWLPFMDYVYSSYEDVMGPAIANRGDMVGALAQWEQQLEGYAEEQGFTVE